MNMRSLIKPIFRVFAFGVFALSTFGVLSAWGEPAKPSSYVHLNKPVQTEVVSTPDHPRPHAKGELLIKFKEGTTDSQAIRAAEEVDLDILEKNQINGTRIYRVRTEHGHSLKECIDKCSNVKNEIEYVEPNYLVQVQVLPNDPSFGSLWGLHNTGQSGGVPDADIDAPEAWDVHTDASGIVVAVIDTGVDWDHPDLASNMWTNPGEVPGNGVDDDGNGFTDDVYGWDFVNNDSNPDDDQSHGTHCAGTIAAIGNNGTGVSGVTWNAKIMALKFLNSSGSGYTSAAISCVQYAIANGANIMSNSWGGGGYSQALSDAITAANNAGILFVAAAGNSNSNNDVSPHYPSNYPQDNVISVAATDRYDNRSSFSSYGLTSVDLGAPGSSILSTVPGGGYGTKSGTSMATPHVSGAAALVWGQNPSLTHLEVKDRLLSRVDPISGLAGLTVTGGRLNVYNALQTETVPPGPIQDLAAAGSSFQSVTLQWTATGDDGNSGNSSRYEVRYSTQPITPSNFVDAALAANLPQPQAPGSQETFEVTGLDPNTTYYFAVKAFDEAGNDSGLSNVVNAPTKPAIFIFQDQVEGGTNGWTVSGSDGQGGGSLWHQSTRRFTSSGNAWYYGLESNGTYNTGAANQGTLVSPPIDLSSAQDPVLQFQTFLETENNVNYDKATVSISSDNGNTWTTVWNKTTTNGSFVNESIDLSGYAGQTILLRFHFDTVDAVFNDYEGWFVDDISVVQSGVPLAAPTGLTVQGAEQALDLNWNANSEPTLAGYKVYISETAQSGLDLEAVRGEDIQTWTEELSFNSSPVNQGWFAYGSTNVWSFNSGIGSLDTTGSSVLSSFNKGWSPNNSTGWTAEVKMKVLQSDGTDGRIQLVAPCGFYTGLRWTAGEVREIWTGASFAMDTTDKFHVYRIVFQGNLFKLFVDGVEQISTTVSTGSGGDPNFRFGDEAGPGSQSQWDTVRFYTGGAVAPDPVTVIDVGNTTNYTVTGLENGKQYFVTVTAYDTGTNESPHSTEKTGVPADTVAPVSVQGLSVQDTFNDQGGSIDLNWNANSEPDLDYYNIYRSTSSFSNVSSMTPLDTATTNVYVDTSVTDGIDYYYAVTAVDLGGNENTSVVAAGPVQSRDDQGPPGVTNFSATAGDAQVSLSWQNPATPDFAGTRIVRKAGAVPSGPSDGTIAYQGAANSFTDSNLTNGTQYFYAAYSFDVTPNYGTPVFANATPIDNVPPAAPAGLVVTSGGPGTLLTQWNANSENDLGGYKLYVSTVTQQNLSGEDVSSWTEELDFDNSPLNQPGWFLFGSNLWSFTGGEARLDTASSSSMSSFNKAWGASMSTGWTVEFRMRVDQSDGLDGRIQLVMPDGNYSGLRFSQNEVREIWTGASYAMDTTDQFHLYRVTKQGNVFRLYVDNELRITTNVSVPSADGNFRFGDEAGPGSQSQWDFVRYYTGGAVAPDPVTVIDAGNVTSYAVTDLTDGVPYFVTVSAYDTSDNEGPKSQERTGVPSDTQAPPAVSGLTAQDTVGDNGGSIDLSWSASSASDLDHYNLYRSASAFNDVTGMTAFAAATQTQHQDTGLTNDTDYYYAVTAVDFGGNEEKAVTSVGPVQAKDDLGPASVTNFSATPGDLSATLSWTNPVDPGFSGTRIVRKTGGFPANANDGTVVYQGLLTGFVDTGLTNGTQYFYGAYSFDSTPNFGIAATASATPVDTVAPSAPTGLNAVSPAIGQALVSWNANPEPDIAGYKLTYATTPQSGAAAEEVTNWTEELDFNADPATLGWTVFSANGFWTFNGGIGTLDTTTASSGVLTSFNKGWSPNNSTGWTAEVKLKVDESGAADGRIQLVMPCGFYTGLRWTGSEVREIWTGASYAMDTTDGFHVYRVTFQGNQFKLYVDGVERISTAVSVGSGGDFNFRFGDEAGPNSRSQWDTVRFYTGGAEAPSPATTVDVGNVTQYTVNGLNSNQTYYFSLTAYDTSNNESVPSAEDSASILEVPGVESAGMEPVSDLRVVQITSRSLYLVWSVPAVEVLEYDVRFSEENLTETSFESAEGITVKAKEGEEPGVLLSGLNADTVYAVALKVLTSGNQASGMSNVAQAATEPAEAMIDSDGDGLSDEDENTLGTDPAKADSDEDGFSDGVEIQAGTDPLDPNSIPEVENNIIFIRQPAGSFPLDVPGLLEGFYNLTNPALFPQGANLFKINSVFEEPVSEPVTEFGEAALRDLFVAQDGSKVLFSMKESSSSAWKIFEINADGSGLRQVSGEGAFNDVEPFYLPGGGIGFVSDRYKSEESESFQVNLFAMNPDGEDVTLLTSDSNYVDFAPSVNEAGEVFFTRLFREMDEESQNEETAVTAETGVQQPLQLKLFRLEMETGIENEVYSIGADADTAEGGVWGLTHHNSGDLISYYGTLLSNSGTLLAGLPFDISPLEAPLELTDPQSALFLNPVSFQGNFLVVSKAVLSAPDENTNPVPVNINLILFDLENNTPGTTLSGTGSWDWMPARLRVPVKE